MSLYRRTACCGPLHPGSPLWSIGFRPLFLLAGMFALLSIAVWVAQFAGWLGSFTYLASAQWHAHEMIFGYIFAVVVGFLFTAVRNWTHHPTPSGYALLTVVVCWIAARACVASGLLAVAAIADTAFATLAALGIAIPLFKARNLRNAIFVLIILSLGAANIAFYVAASRASAATMQTVIQLGLDLILLVITVVAGRVIPMFSASAGKGASPQRNTFIECTAIASAVLLTAVHVIGLPLIAIWIAGIGALAHGARLTMWKPWTAMRMPILLILHASYAWLVIYLALLTLSGLGFVSYSIALHALTVGAIGGLTIGMMSRVARGHTGRPLIANRLEVYAYALIQLAGAMRVLLPIVLPNFYFSEIVVAGALWSAAFFLLTVFFLPTMTRPRADGRAS